MADGALTLDRAVEFRLRMRWEATADEEEIEALVTISAKGMPEGKWCVGRSRTGGGWAVEALSETGFFAGWSAAWSASWGEYDTADAALLAAIESGGLLAEGDH